MVQEEPEVPTGIPVPADAVPTSDEPALPAQEWWHRPYDRPLSDRAFSNDDITPEERAERARNRAAAERYQRLRQASYRKPGDDDGGGWMR